MSDPIVAAVLTVLILVLLAAWMPFIRAMERMVRRSPQESASTTLDVAEAEQPVAQQEAA